MVTLWYPLPGWKHALFFPPGCHGRTCPTNSRSIETWFPRDAVMCTCCCSALMSNKVQDHVNISPQQSHFQQLFPPWIPGVPSRLRMLLFPSPLREGISSLHSPLAAHLFPQQFETFYPWRDQDLCLNIFPCICPLEQKWRLVLESSSNPCRHIQTLNI